MDSILAILAHPDDEVFISGTLSLAVRDGLKVNVVYVTSGDAGTDKSGRRLKGEKLAREREIEVRSALREIGLIDQPYLLRFPDGKTSECLDEIKAKIREIFFRLKPSIVISFGPDGITGHKDHINTGIITTTVFGETGIGEKLYWPVLPESMRDLLGEEGYSLNFVADRRITTRVDISRALGEKIRALSHHRTQFSEDEVAILSRIFSSHAEEDFILAMSAGRRETILW